MHRIPFAATRLAGLSVAMLALAAVPVWAGASATAAVRVTVEVHARTVLRVSTHQLQFDLPSDARSATAELDFSAAARTRRDGEVMLTVEPEQWLEGPGGAADVDALVTFEGNGEGVAAGQLAPSAPSVAGRWLGSGKRDGHLRFTLQADAAGTYRLPVRLVLTAL
jgi:hypothetical protein